MKKELHIQSLQNWSGIKKKPLLIAGPCSAETEAQVLSTAKEIKKINENCIYRAGIWKPRTRPGSFEGIGEPALEWLRTVQLETGLKTATEVANAKHVELCLKHGVDVLWIGARTTVNPFSVQEIADTLKGVDIPVLVKNPVNPDLQLWIGALERLNKGGITKLAAILRGFNSSEPSIFRNPPQWEMAIQLKTALPELPLLCDPSHICGNTEMLDYISQKAMDLDFDGLMIETHVQPQLAWSDAKQQITPSQLKKLITSLRVRKVTSENKQFTDKLNELRDQIDKIDEKLLYTLHERLSVSEKIGTYKKENNVTILQTGRWTEIQEKLDMQSDLMGFERDWLKKLYDLIHEASIKKQREVMK
ncbi:MAG TPA: chorismate mutase [Bacteroidia bacterium]|jgi:chorismate mutase|nr:chorismate mutase [Bacteroidia bacterium]